MDIKKEQEIWQLLNNLTTTENGEVAFKSTGDKNIDLFGTVNRGVDIRTLVTKFVDAWNENPEYAIKVLLNFRDIREGKGEKLISKVILLVIKIVHPDIYEQLLPLFIEVGCWKDLLFMYEMSIYCNVESNVEILAIAKQLKEDQISEHPSLCAKWAPTEGCHFDRKTKICKKISKELKFKNQKQYRKLLTSLRTKISLVETKLSQNHLSEINFSTIPSKAHMIYKKAFLRGTNTEGESSTERTELAERYKKYLEDLTKGKEKANFKGIMPHELIKELLNTNGINPELTENQWNSLRNEISNISVFDRCVSIVDVSGSMSSGTNSGSRPIDVAIALGILVSECAKGPFKNKMFTFHEFPTLADLSDISVLYDKVKYVEKLPWGGNTDIEAVFDKIIEAGILFNIPSNEMPERLFIFTDMQFDKVSGNRLKTFDKIKEKFAKHGYKMPQIICWNLSNCDNVVFTKDEQDVCMLSGFSTPILKAFLTCKEINPLIVFLSAINDYKVPNVILKPIDISKIDLQKIELAVEKSDFKYNDKKDKDSVVAHKQAEEAEEAEEITINIKTLSSSERVSLVRKILELDDDLALKKIVKEFE